MERMTKRWIVLFTSTPNEAGEVDMTPADVRASSAVRAIAEARKTTPPHHPWVLATATPWPKGCRSIDAAADLAASG